MIAYESIPWRTITHYGLHFVAPVLLALLFKERCAMGDDHYGVLQGGIYINYCSNEFRAAQPVEDSCVCGQWHER